MANRQSAAGIRKVKAEMIARILPFPCLSVYLEPAMRVLTFLLVLASCCQLRAQDYLVTVKGDTIRGTVRIHSYDLMDRVSVNVDGKKTNFTAIQVRNVFYDSVKLVPVRRDNSIRFMRVLESGYLTLYSYRLENQVTYDGRLLAKMNGKQLEVPNIGFKRILADFLEDCESTSVKVKEGEFERGDLEALVQDYNACVADQNKGSTSLTKPTPAMEALAVLKTKVESSSLEGKKDVVDMLNDIDRRLRLRESIPPYLTNGLKSSLADKTEFEEELNKFLSSLN
jgi:hypothetical protein